MGRVILRKVVLNDFRTFVGRHEIDFSESGVALMEGDNQDTKGKSASGKTNVLLGISYLFGHCPHPANALQSWYSETPFSVEGHMDTDEGPAVLIRGAKGLSLKVGAEKKLTGSKAVEERLDRLCGVGGDLREILTYRDQRDPKKFLSMKDKEMKEFLTTVLRLGGLEKEIDTATKRTNECDRRAEDAARTVQVWTDANVDRLKAPQGFEQDDTKELEDQVTVLSADLLGLEERLAEVKKLYADALLKEEADVAAAGLSNREAVEAVHQVLAELRGRKPPALDTTEQTRLLALLETAKGHITKMVTAEQQRLNEHREQQEGVRRKIRYLRDEMIKSVGLKIDRDRLDAANEKLAQSLCSTCGRQWDEARAELARNEVQVKALTAQIAAIDEHAEEVKALDVQLAAMVFTQDPRLDKLRDAKAAIEGQLAAERLRLGDFAQAWTATHRQEVALAEAKLREESAKGLAAASAILTDPARHTKRLENNRALHVESLHEQRAKRAKVQSALDLMRSRNEERSRQHADAVVQHTKALEHQAGLMQGAETGKKIWQAESDYLDLLRGFRNKIFDEVLDRIGVEASAIIADLPNAQNIRIEFRSERETGAGTIENKIKPVTFIYGEERPLASSVSGGQYTSIELAVDLAVARVITQRLGCNLNWIILDESFNGHDHITKASCLTMLQQYAADKLVIVVDHASEFKELFQQQIVVRLKDKLSTIHATPGAAQ
jgi:hypothetical protein